jgi:AcrR family transcriptional regulator
MSTRTPSRHASRPPLETKVQPAQKRAAETYELLLDAAAKTLAEQGIERLSTNLVAERAGVTPPALYRYFPNKYALLSELGKRLMQRQNECIDRWISPEALAGGSQTLEPALAGLLLDTYNITRKVEGGVWIMRALRAVPALQEVRLGSHAEVTAAQVRLQAKALPGVKRSELVLVNRIVVELIYAAVEMLFDEKLDAKAVARIVAGMLSSHLDRVMRAKP